MADGHGAQRRRVEAAAVPTLAGEEPTGGVDNGRGGPAAAAPAVRGGWPPHPACRRCRRPIRRRGRRAPPPWPPPPPCAPPTRADGAPRAHRGGPPRTTPRGGAPAGSASRGATGATAATCGRHAARHDAPRHRLVGTTESKGKPHTKNKESPWQTTHPSTHQTNALAAVGAPVWGGDTTTHTRPAAHPTSRTTPNRRPLRGEEQQRRSADQ